jgi:hypothetical protein
LLLPLPSGHISPGSIGPIPCRRLFGRYAWRSSSRTSSSISRTNRRILRFGRRTPSSFVCMPVCCAKPRIGFCDDGRTGAPVGRLIALAADHADTVTILTFNHDLVIENEIFRRARLTSRWCLDVGYGSIEDELSAVAAPGVATFDLHADGRCDHDRPLRILKLHGSLNWAIRLNSDRPTAKTLLGEGAKNTMYLTPGRQLMARPQIEISGSRGRRRWQTWPVIIPPVYSKQALRRRLQPVWQDARSAIEDCDRLVFFGYSLPQIDIEAEKLMERGVATNGGLKWADIINPAPASAQRYAGLAPALPIRWYPSLTRFIDDDPFDGSERQR